MTATRELTRSQWVRHCMFGHFRQRVTVEHIEFLGIPIEDRHICGCGRYWIDA